MKVETYLFGPIEVVPEKVITFPLGLTAFEQCKRFMLVHEENEQPSSFTLQSLDDPGLAFQIVDPTILGFNYELALSEQESKLLQNPKAEDVGVMLILFKKDVDGKPNISPNLRAPLLINMQARIGLQKVMESCHSNVTLSNLSSAV